MHMHVYQITTSKHSTSMEIKESQLQVSDGERQMMIITFNLNLKGIQMIFGSLYQIKTIIIILRYLDNHW